MKKTVALLLGMGFAVLLWVLESQRGAAAQNENQNEPAVDRESSVDRAIDNHAHKFLAQGKQIFRVQVAARAPGTGRWLPVREDLVAKTVP